MDIFVVVELSFFHLEKAFEKAAEIAKERIEDKNREDYLSVYSFDLEHTKTMFKYYDFGERNSYEYTFLIREK